ncbi:leucine-rich repeat protein [Tanacetum coccineum]
MANNSFSGKLTIDFSKLRDIYSIRISNNNFHGRGEADDMRFINSLRNCTRLVDLELGYCNLIGMLPISIGSLVGLTSLVLGPIPDGIGNLSMLTKLYLESNKLEGHIPSSLGKCKELNGLNLGDNVFGHVLNECPKQSVLDVLENLKTPRQAVRGVPISLKVGFKQTKQVYRHVSQKNSASISGKKKQSGSSKQEVSNLNPFDALSSVENDDDLGTNRGNSKVAEKGANSDVVFSVHGSSPVASCSPNNTPLAKRINNLERKMLNGKLILVDDDGKPLNKVDYVSANSDSGSDVEVAYDETAQFMASGGANVANLYEDEYDIYNTYDIEGLSKKDLVFCDMMDINHCGHDRI